MYTRKKKFILFPRKVVIKTYDSICVESKLKMFCFVNQVKYKCLDHKHTTYYSTKI